MPKLSKEKIQNIIQKYNDILEEHNCRVYTDVNTFTKTSDMIYTCKCGKNFKRDSYELTNKKRFYCGGIVCSEEKREPVNKTKTSQIQSYIEENNINAQIINNDIIVTCDICGTVFKTDINTLKRKKHKKSCTSCARTKLSKLKVNDSKKEQFEDFLHKHGCTLHGEYISAYKETEIKCKCNEIFAIKPNYIYQNDNICCKKCMPIGTSNQEQDLIQFIKDNYDGEIILNDRQVLNGKELDIYLPDIKLAIEYNGLYWHSDKFKNKNYHFQKTNDCEDQNIQLIHVFENEYTFKKDLIQSILLTKMNKCKNVIYARKCIVKEIDTRTKNEFLEINHRQGKDSSSIKLGLFHNDELVSVMTFGKPRFNKKYKYELIRLCSLKNHNIIGGASKLLKHFIKYYTEPNETILSYADRRYSFIHKNVYKSLGFSLMNISKPNFFYFTNGDLSLQSRNKYQKHKQKNILKIFDENLSAEQNMKNNGFNKIYDSGNIVYYITT